MHQTVARARPHIKTAKKNTMLGVARNRPHCQRCSNVGRFSATLLLCEFATGCDRTHWHGCAQQSLIDATTLLVSAIAATCIVTAAWQVVFKSTEVRFVMELSGKVFQ